jgi:hypothetical protein
LLRQTRTGQLQQLRAVMAHVDHLSQSQVLGDARFKHSAGNMCRVDQQDPVARAQATAGTCLKLKAFGAFADHLKLDGFAFGALFQL